MCMSNASPAAGRPATIFPDAGAGRVKRETVRAGDAATGRGDGVQYAPGTPSRLRVREALTLLFDFDWVNRNYFYGLDSRDGFSRPDLSAYAATGHSERARFAGALSRMRCEATSADVTVAAAGGRSQADATARYLRALTPCSARPAIVEGRALQPHEERPSRSKSW